MLVLAAQATSAGQAAVLAIAPLLSAEEVELHVLKPLDGLARHDEDEARKALSTRTMSCPPPTANNSAVRRHGCKLA